MVTLKTTGDGLGAIKVIVFVVVVFEVEVGLDVGFGVGTGDGDGDGDANANGDGDGEGNGDAVLGDATGLTLVVDSGKAEGLGPVVTMSLGVIGKSNLFELRLK